MQHDSHKSLLLYKPMKKYSYEKYIKKKEQQQKKSGIIDCLPGYSLLLLFAICILLHAKSAGNKTI